MYYSLPAQSSNIGRKLRLDRAPIGKSHPFLTVVGLVTLSRHFFGIISYDECVGVVAVTTVGQPCGKI